MNSALPYQLIASLRSLPGFSEEAFINVHNNKQTPVSIRFNQRKLAGAKMEAGDIFTGEQVPWCKDAIYLDERPSYTTDPFFHAGMYYVQEASSMALQEALRQTVDKNSVINVIDLCAAPGGKSTLILAFINEESLLVSNEVIKTRVNVLTENMIKWGGGNVVITNNDPAGFQRLPNFFDLMVVDAPCSGSGLFRRDPSAIEEWSLQNVVLCSQRQQRILADALPALKPGGILIYSTCSYSKEEDECIADWLIDNADMEIVSLNLPGFWKVVQTSSPKHHAPGYRFYPDKLQGEGFFMTVMRKKGHPVNQHYRPGKKIEQASKPEREIINKQLENKEDFIYLKNNENIFRWPRHLLESLQIMKDHLYIKYAGTDLGTIGKNELIPHHALAMHQSMKMNYPVIDLSMEEALDYLRRNDINPPTEIKGWGLVKYKSAVLGFVKVLPQRMNNYYPRQWRIINK